MTLTVQAGTIIKFLSGQTLNILGVLELQGSTANPIYITSYQDDSVGGDSNADGTASSPGPGDWSNIYLADNASATFDFTTIRYSGGSQAAIYAPNNGTVILRDSTISNSAQNGIGMNTYCCVAYTSNLTVERSLIADNGRLGIEMGAASGGTNNLVVTDSTIRNNNGTGIYIHRAGALQITDDTLNDNSGYPLQLINTSLNYTVVTGLSASGNTNNAIYLQGNTFTGTSILSAEVPYALAGLNIPADAQLQLQPGAILKMFDNYSLGINGSLLSQGTSGNPVYITSWYDDSIGGDTNADGNATSPFPGNWSNIYLADNASATFDFTTIRYSGGSQAAIWAPNNGTVILRDLIISDSSSNGIWMNTSCCLAYTSSLTVERSLIADNGRLGIEMGAYNEGVNNLVITDSTIRNNNATGIWINRAETLQITNNSINSNLGYPLQLFSTTLNYTVVTGLSASGNRNNAIYLQNITFTGNSILSAEVPYALAGLNIPADAQCNFSLVLFSRCLTITPLVSMAVFFPKAHLAILFISPPGMMTVSVETRMQMGTPLLPFLATGATSIWQTMPLPPLTSPPFVTVVVLKLPSGHPIMAQWSCGIRSFLIHPPMGSG